MKMKLLTAAVLITAASSIQAKVYYLSTTGNDNNQGTSLEKPFATAEKAFSMLNAGDTLYMRGGTYYPTTKITVNQTGTKDARICVFNFPDDTIPPVLNFSKLDRSTSSISDTNRGILHNIGANYWYYRGFDICNAPDNGMKLEGSYCVVEKCNFYGNGDTGLQQGFGKGSNGENTRNPNFFFGRYNIIINCDSYNNYDSFTSGGNADGFAVKLFPGPGNEFHGCRAWDNSDDAWDLYYTAFPVLIDHCWAIHNGYHNNQESGNGNGIKFGGLKQGGVSLGAHVVKNCIAAYNLSKGFDQNHHLEGSYLFNCLSFKNNINYGFNMEQPTYGNWTLYNCIGFAPVDRNHRFTINPICKNDSWIDIDHTNPICDKDKGTDSTGTAYTVYKSSSAWPDYSGNFEDISYEAAVSKRQTNGELPTKFGRLKSTAIYIDKGTDVENFTTTDQPKDYYKYSDKAPASYPMTITIPHSGTKTDMGAYEYGLADSLVEYNLIMPVNDGSVDDATPQAEEMKDSLGNLYAEKIILNWYNFEDSIAPDSISYLTWGNTEGAVYWKPNYMGKGSDGKDATTQVANYTGSIGALRIPKTEHATLTMNNLRMMNMKIYCTGSRTLTITKSTDNGTTWSQVMSGSYKSGSATVGDIAVKEKNPVIVKIENTLSKGDMYITDLYLTGYQLVDENGNPVTAISNISNETEDYDMLQTENGLIVYGKIKSLDIYDMNGRRIAASRQQQYINLSNINPGLYIVKINGRISKKFVKSGKNLLH